MELKLIRPCREYQTQITAMLDAWLQAESPAEITPWSVVRQDYHDFDHYCTHLDIRSERYGLVPDVTLFCYDRERDVCVGAVNIRLVLNDRLRRVGGHIGDGICPTERGKGCGTAMVGLAVAECRRRGMERVLMVCEKENVASAKTIIRNGGVLENEVDDDGCILQRYWIDLK